MSDIQTTEAEREEALKRLRDEEEVRIKVAEVKIAACGLAEYYSDGDLVEDLRETKRGNGMEAPEEYVINYYEACARVRQYCARIRADAVKAERERCIGKAIEALDTIDKTALSLGKKIGTVYGRMCPPEMQMEKAVSIMKTSVLFEDKEQTR